MATRITKPELEQQLIASQRDNAALREKLSVAHAEIERLSNALLDAAQTLQTGSEQEQANAAQRSFHAANPAQREAKRSDWPHAKGSRPIPEAFAKAREMAMRLGRSVKVGA